PTHTTTLSLHDALPISDQDRPTADCFRPGHPAVQKLVKSPAALSRTLARFLSLDHALTCLLAGSVAVLIWFSLHLAAMRIFQVRSEEHTSELQSPDHLV